VHRLALVEAAVAAPEAGVVQLDLGAHALQGGHVREAPLEQRLVEHGQAVALREQHDER
jgi:hypothetical protein